MKSITLKLLEVLRSKELIYKENGHGSGLVSLLDAEDLLQQLEIKLLNEEDVNNS